MEQDILKGIAGYKKQQQVLQRLLRKRGKFTSKEFDGWFRGREFKRPRRLNMSVTGDSFILGMGANGGTEWAFYLDLMQKMMAAGLIDAKTINGEVVYFPMGQTWN